MSDCCWFRQILRPSACTLCTLMSFLPLLSSVIDQYDILTTVVELKSEWRHAARKRPPTHEQWNHLILLCALWCGVGTFLLRMYFWNFKCCNKLCWLLTCPTLLFKSNSMSNILAVNTVFGCEIVPAGHSVVFVRWWRHWYSRLTMLLACYEYPWSPR